MIMKRFLLVLLCVTLIFCSLTLFGCEPSREETGDVTSAVISESGGDTEAGQGAESDTDAESGSVTTESPKPSVLMLSEGGEARYKVVCPDDADDKTATLALMLGMFLSEESGADFEASSDFVGWDVDPDGVSEYEILLAGTNRSADDAVLAEAGSDGWCVTAVENRIVIHAKSVFSLADAVDYFKSVLVTVDGNLGFDPTFSKVERREYALVGTTLRVGSYNIKHGADVKLDFSVIAADIRELNLDVIGFQEIDKCTRRVNGMDTPKAIAEALGYAYYYYTKAIDYQGGEYGTLIVSRYPIEDAESIAFPVHSGYEARAMGHVVINVNGAKVDFYNTHLSYEKDWLIEEQFGMLQKTLNGGRGFIVTGDFNTEEWSYFETLENTQLVNPDKFITFPSSSKSIDNIILETGWTIVASGVGPEGHSDHNLLWAEICYTGQK